MTNIKFKENVNLEEILKHFKDNGNSYDLDSPFDEFISIDKATRIITQYGYNGLVASWYSQGLLELC